MLQPFLLNNGSHFEQAGWLRDYFAVLIGDFYSQLHNYVLQLAIALLFSAASFIHHASVATILQYMELFLEFNHKLPVTLLQVFPEVLFDSINGLPANLQDKIGGKGGRGHVSDHYSSLVHTRTLLTRRSVSSKCLPNSLGASPGMDSILIHTSWPLRALSTTLWLTSKLVTTPRSQNYKHSTKCTVAVWDTEVKDRVQHMCQVRLTSLVGTVSGVPCLITPP